MANKGKHQEPVHNYPTPEATHIEKLFLEAAKGKISNLEREQWFGDYEKRNRYRVDFLIKNKRVVIELDGRGTHLTEDQRENDAKRQRYLERSGYRVIRFTGKEIVRNVDQCVDEVLDFLGSLDIQYPIHRKVMYIDQLFVEKQIHWCINFYKEIHPNQNFEYPSLQEIVKQILACLHVTSDIEAYIFKTDFQNVDTSQLHDTTQHYEKGIIKYRVYDANFISLKILEHLEYHAIYYDKFILVADDPIYISFLKCIGTNGIARLARRDNYHTRMIGEGLEKLSWQDIDYAIGFAMGLKQHEL